MSNIKNAYSVKESEAEIAQDIKSQFGRAVPKMVLFFSTSNVDPKKISKEMQVAFPDSKVFGCTTSGEIVSGDMLKNSVVAMAFNSKAVDDVSIQIVKNIKEKDGVKAAFKRFEKHYEKPVNDLDIKKFVGIVLMDGMSGAEEKIMDSIGNQSNLTFIGGSAGDDLKFKSTQIFADGKVYEDAALLALVKTKKGFDILKTQSFKVTDKKLVATKVNEAARTVVEFDGKPAVKAYAKAIGATPKGADKKFMHNPVGLMVGNEPYVRSPQQVKGDEMVFYCNIKKGSELTILEGKDIVADTRKDLKKKIKELGDVSGIVNFHCILRTLELESLNKTKAYGNVFKDVPTIGFSTYGESYIGHINQTSTMLIFK